MTETSSAKPEGLFDRRTAKILLTIIAFAMVLAILYVARSVIVLFAFAILLAYLINPVVRFLQRHSLFFKNLRGPHVAEAYLTFLVLAVFVIHTFAPDLHRHPTLLLERTQSLIDRTSSGDIAVNLGTSFGWSDSQTARGRHLSNSTKQTSKIFSKRSSSLSSSRSAGCL